MLNNRFFQIQVFEKYNSLEIFFKNKNLSPSNIKNSFEKKLIYVNKKIASQKTMIEPGMCIQVFCNEEEKKKYFTENALQIIHCDIDFLVINKPYGMTVHFDLHHKKNNVVFFLKKWLNFSESEFENLLPVIHRIDKPTTGLFLLARNPDSAKYLKFLMKKRTIKKKYLALVEGQLEKSEFTINAPLIKPGKQKKATISFAGKSAETYIKILEQKNNFALVKCELLTGRTHQIRSHLKFINHPILNDSLYNNSQSDFLFLHSYKIEFNYFDKKKNFCFVAPLPSFFKKKLMSDKNI